MITDICDPIRFGNQQSDFALARLIRITGDEIQDPLLLFKDLYGERFNGLKDPELLLSLVPESFLKSPTTNDCVYLALSRGARVSLPPRWEYYAAENRPAQCTFASLVAFDPRTVSLPQTLTEVSQAMDIHSVPLFVFETAHTYGPYDRTKNGIVTFYDEKKGVAVVDIKKNAPFDSKGDRPYTLSDEIDAQGTLEGVRSARLMEGTEKYVAELFTALMSKHA